MFNDDLDKLIPALQEIQTQQLDAYSDIIKRNCTFNTHIALLFKDFSTNIDDEYIQCYLKNNSNFYIHFSFTNTDKRDNLIYSLLLYVEKNKENYKITKVSSYPSLEIIPEYICDFDKKLNNKNEKTLFVDNYKKAIQSAKKGLYAGAFLYIRRIFEKMINYIAETKLDEEKKSNYKNKKTKMEDKLKLIKNYIPHYEEISYKNFYSILSKGIHTLPDETCKEIYIIVKETIEMTTYQIYKEDKENKRISKIQSSLSKIMNQNQEA